MYLKRLESVGFKSFAERISIDFVQGMTAIVGPNGSGKSNITDAIRWALGEQSVRSLRGTKMEDIIFQGSDSRKPLNFAEVNLVLDNSKQTLPLDYEEISILRRVYRSGASEFYINKQACRLKDIIDLFMDSGLGQESFSIISQGKVEEVLSSKAEDRRTIFEEAAGVLKYKQRKQKAEYKLAETAENLYRINDIIHEIDNQIEPLLKQANKAKEYNAIQKQLVKAEVALLRTEIEDLHTKWKEHQVEIKSEQEKELNIKTAIQINDADIEKKRQTLRVLDEAVEKNQQVLLTLTQQLEQLEGKKHVLKTQLSHSSENKESTLMLQNEVGEQKKKLMVNLKEEESKLKQLKTNHQETVKKIDVLEKQVAIGEEGLRAEIEQKRTEYVDYLNEQAVKANAIKTMTEQLEKLLKNKADETTVYEKLNQRYQKAVIENHDLEVKLEEKQQSFKSLQTKLESLKHKLVKERSGLTTLQANLSKIQQEIAKVTSTKEMLTEMKEDFQGFFHGVKHILQARDDKALTGIYGAVVELTDVPSNYSGAIETALGAQAQHIIVLNKETAREAIRFLRDDNKGRATFLPLDTIESRQLPEKHLQKIKDHDGYIGIAADLVKVDSRYQGIIDHLLGHIIVSDNLMTANNLATLLNQRYRIVTLTGDVVNRGGSMTGGARNRGHQSLFTRDHDLEEAKIRLDQLNEKAKTSQEQIAEQQKNITDHEKHIQVTEAQITQLQTELQNTQLAYDRSQMSCESLVDQLASHKRNKKQGDLAEKELLSVRQETTKELTMIKDTLVTYENLIKELEKQVEKQQETQAQTEEQLQKYHITFAGEVERIKNQEDKINQMQEELNVTTHQYKQITNDLKRLMDVEQLEERSKQLNANQKTKQKEKQTLTETIQSQRQERLDLMKTVADTEREQREQNKQQQIHLKKIQEKEVLANRLDVLLENKLSELETKYAMTYERAKQTYDKVTDQLSTKAKVLKLNEEIKALGPVNLDAINEHERIAKRHQFLLEQQKDLTEAKKTLYSVIDELDGEMIKRFEETFNQIKVEFSKVFIELFGGGRAELSLSHPEEVLTTGIDIVAQPPGKRLQHLGLLSGGERALTAIALLFAILRVRPVPFCVLDEVESALDEANVTRFAKYVKQHSDETQFIVITHRKGTMEEADVLYGVTMQEPGVSRLVSVKLGDAEELIN